MLVNHSICADPFHICPNRNGVRFVSPYGTHTNYPSSSFIYGNYSASPASLVGKPFYVVAVLNGTSRCPRNASGN